MKLIRIPTLTLVVTGTLILLGNLRAIAGLTVSTPHAPLQTTIGLPVNFAYTPNWYVVYDPTKTIGVGFQPYLTLGGTFLNLQCNGEGVLVVNQNPGSNPLSLQASTGIATMNFGLTAGLNLEFIAFGDTLNGSLNTGLLPNNGDLGFYDSQSFSSYLLDSPVNLSSTLSLPLLPPINTLDALTLWFGVAIPDWLAGIDLDINTDTTIGQSILGQSITTSAGTISSEGQTLYPYVSGATYQLQNVQETWQDTTSLTLGLGADLTASLLWDTIDVTLVNFGSVPLITTAQTYPLTSAPIPSLSFNINSTTATSISLGCNVSPNQNVAPSSPVTVSGTAIYNNGQVVPSATVTISLAGQTWTAPVSNGSYSRSITAPSSPGSYTVACSVSDGDGRTGSASSPLSVVANGTTSSYTLNGFLMCQYVNPNSPYNYTGATVAFSGTNTAFYVWTELDNVYGAHTVTIQLYRPDGTYYGQTTANIPNSTTQGYAYWSWYRVYADWDVAGYDIGNTPGTWTVRLVIDGNYEQSTSFVMRYQFMEHLMCQDVQSSSPYNPINPGNLFNQADVKATTWCMLQTVSDPLSVKWIFYEPNGSEYATFTNSIPSPQSSGYAYWSYYNCWGWIDIAGNSAANKCGNWRVDVFLSDEYGNWQKQYSDYFTIVENPPVPPSANVTAVPASPQAGQSITLDAACTDNTYLRSVVVYWNDGFLHSNVWNNIIAGSFNQSVVIGPYAAEQQVEYWAVATDTSGNTAQSNPETLSIVPVPGSLQVSLSPQAAITDGGAWQLDGGAWQNSGTTISGIIPGSHTVDFEPIPGWTKPNQQSVTVFGGQTNTLTGTYVIEPQPNISINTGSLSQTIVVGQTNSNQSFQVWNDGSGTLSYTIGTTAAWLSTSPTNGTSTGEKDLIQVNYNGAHMAAGNYNATIAVIAPGATNSPQPINVNLIVVAAPTIRIAIVGNQVTLSWPTNTANFTLQSRTNLVSGQWNVVNSGINIVGTNYVATIPINATTSFFRLEQ